jgi:membrane associated rhomboid family serine protease
VLIAINIVVFLFLQKKTGFSGVDDAQTVKWAAIPYEFTHPSHHCLLSGGVTGDISEARQIVCPSHGYPSQPHTWITAFTSMFMHGSYLHLAGNMLFLWIFGNNVEDAMGPVRFVVFYLLGGIAALALQIAVNPDSMVPTLGASGAIAGVLGGYILLYPRARVMTLIFIIFFVTLIEIPAVFVLGIWFAEQLVFGAVGVSHPTSDGGGVAYFAHIGGFAFGLLAIHLFARRVKNVPQAAPRYRF